MLTKAQVEQYREEGYLVVEGVLEGRRRGVRSLDRAGRPAALSNCLIGLSGISTCLITIPQKTTIGI
jgi:hypothetical protein